MLQKPRPAGLLIPLSFFLALQAVSKKPVKQVKASEGNRDFDIPVAGREACAEEGAGSCSKGLLQGC